MQQVDAPRRTISLSRTRPRPPSDIVGRKCSILSGTEVLHGVLKCEDQKITLKWLDGKKNRSDETMDSETVYNHVSWTKDIDSMPSPDHKVAKAEC